MTTGFRQLALLLLFSLLAGCSCQDDNEQGLKYIENYIEIKSGVKFQDLMDQIEAQREDLRKYASIASEVSNEMSRLMESGDIESNGQLREYIDGLSEDQRNAPKNMTRIANDMSQSMSKAINVFAIQTAVMVVTEEVCGNPKAGERWKDLLFRVNAELTGKLPDSDTKKVESTFWSFLEIVATDLEDGNYDPPCDVQKENTRFMRYAKIVLDKT